MNFHNDIFLTITYTSEGGRKRTVNVCRRPSGFILNWWMESALISEYHKLGRSLTDDEVRSLLFAELLDPSEQEIPF